MAYVFVVQYKELRFIALFAQESVLLLTLVALFGNCMLLQMRFSVVLSRPVSAVVKLSLIDAYVLPIMTLCSIEAVSLSRGQYDELSVCCNNLFRRISNMHKCESVKALQYYCGSLGFTRLCDLRRLRFLHKISVCQNVAHSKNVLSY